MKNPRHFRKFIRFVLVLGLVVPACASQPKRLEVQPWEAEMNDLKARQIEMNAQLDGLQQKIMVLENRLVADHQQNAATEMQTPVVKLEPDADSEPVVITLNGDEGGIQRPARKPVAPKKLSKADVAREYNRLYQKYNKGDCQDTVVEFNAFATANPTSSFADNAQYWIGECYYRMKEYTLSIGEFKKVVTEYPKGNKVPDAYLKIAMAQSALGKEKEAQDTYQRLLASFPQSEAAVKAKTQMGGMHR